MGSGCSSDAAAQATAPNSGQSASGTASNTDVSKKYEPEPLRLPPDASGKGNQAKPDWGKWDKNGDEIVTRDEYQGAAGQAQALNITQNVIQMFHALLTDEAETISITFFTDILKRMGLEEGDSRLTTMFASLKALNCDRITLEQFSEAINSCATLVEDAVKGNLKVPDFETLCGIVAQVYEKVLPNKGGNNADYIPTLARVDPEQFAISFCSIDGQRFNIGDSDKQFCIQSCCKPINYLIGLNAYGPDYVHDAVGKEPSGVKFNQMVLKERPGKSSIPHNPMINAGAIMSVSMVFPTIKSRQERLEKVLNIWKRLSGGDQAPIGYEHETYVSESATADRNWCLGYMMKESLSFPECFNDFGDEALKETLELYFQTCSILSTNDAMGIMSATLANGGFCPLTGDQVFTPEEVRSVLPLMLTCGMYDYSGQWAYDVGIPAKSGVGGCVYMVIPNIGGFSIWSPRLDAVGNSERGVHAATELVKYLAMHNFEVFSGLSVTKMELTVPKYETTLAASSKIFSAATYGDTSELIAQHNSGADLFWADYDERTPLHIAASEGQSDAVKFIVKAAAGDQSKISHRDRWHGTPLGDARRGLGENPDHAGYQECVKLLEAAGAEGDDRGTLDRVEAPANEAAEAQRVLSAAAHNDVKTLVNMSAAGMNLFCLDYDSRTALHLAASNGHIDVIRYLLAQMDHSSQVQQAAQIGSSMLDLTRLEQEEASMRVQAKIQIVRAQDRFHGTPAADATREGHQECLKVLEEAVAKLKRQLKEIEDGNIPKLRGCKVSDFGSSSNLAAQVEA